MFMNLYNTPKNLGDKIDSILYAHALAIHENTTVKLRCDIPEKVLFNDFINANSERVELVDHIETKSINISWEEATSAKNEIISEKNLNKIFNLTRKNVQETDLELPENYITVQWDAQQNYRVIKPKRLETIKKFYSNYNSLAIGGKANNSKLTGKSSNIKHMLYTLSKANLHIGTDSGIMNLAKFAMPLEKIYIYIRLYERKNDLRFIDSWTASEQIRRLGKWGVYVNPFENGSEPDADGRWDHGTDELIEQIFNQKRKSNGNESPI